MASVSELSVKYKTACAGREPFLHKAGLGLLGRCENSALLLSDLLHGQDCALQPQFHSCSFQLEAGESPVVSTQLPVSGYPVQCVPQQVEACCFSSLKCLGEDPLPYLDDSAVGEWVLLRTGKLVDGKRGKPAKIAFFSQHSSAARELS